MLEHAVTHLGAGRLISVEVDAFWLPDTASSDYRKQHTKTTIAMVDLDIDQERLGYLHNAGYYELAGEDFRQIFGLESPDDPGRLHLYAELVHINRVFHRDQADLVSRSYALLQQYVELRPATNPIKRFAACFNAEVVNMQAKGLPYYHAWAFSNTRQLGSAFELAAANLAWLEAAGIQGLKPAREHFIDIANGNKSLILKVARAVHSGRALDATELFENMAQAWEQGMAALDLVLKSCRVP